MPRSIIIVGGSVAGLMHGLQLKRDGNDVTILEREPAALRSSHNAGISYREEMKAFLEKFDDTGVASSIASDKIRFGYRKRPAVYTASLKLELTSWGLLYRLLRANFDGFASIPYPQPPPRRTGDGNATYLTGKQVTDIKTSDDGAIVHYSDAVSGESASMAADLVIGADGLHSTVRQIVRAPAVREYSGYVSWRGTVPERELSQATADYFANGLTYDLISRSYILCYVIPTDEGGLGPSERLINWVWYCNIADGSSEMKDTFTDCEGNLHANTVGQGLVSVPVWNRVRDAGVAQMAPPFAELLCKTDQPFVTKVNDVLCTQSRYLNDRVLLVGDALSTFRPNMAMATEQAAKHCLWVGQALRGELPMDKAEEQIAVFAERFFLLSRVVGQGGQGSWFSFARIIWRYLRFMVHLKMRKS